MQVREHTVQPSAIDEHSGSRPRSRAEHEVVDEQLRAAVEQLAQRLGALVGVEPVVLLNANPRQLAPLPRKLVAQPGVLLLAVEQLLACGEPFVTCFPVLWSVMDVSSRGAEPFAEECTRRVS